jgi:ATP-dependent Clp protease ATP-binding subunit ClpB
MLVTDVAKKLLGEEGYDPVYGARPLKRVIQQRIENPLSSRLLSGDFPEGQTIKIDVDQAKHEFSFSTASAGEAAEPAEAEAPRKPATAGRR